MKKRALLIVMALTMCMFSVTACSGSSDSGATEEEAEEGLADASDDQINEALDDAIDDAEEALEEGKSEDEALAEGYKDEANADKY